MRGTGNDTIGDFFDQLLFEHREATSEVAHADNDAHMPRLPVGYIAELLHRFGHVPFETAGKGPADLHDELCQCILQELGSVQAYVNT